MTKTLILPGLDGSPDPHWQHWWAATDPGALTLEQQDWARPTHEAWEHDDRFRRDRGMDWPALLVFGIVYLAALGVIVSPGSLRADGPVVAEAEIAFPVKKGAP